MNTHTPLETLSHDPVQPQPCFSLSFSFGHFDKHHACRTAHSFTSPLPKAPLHLLASKTCSRARHHCSTAPLLISRAFSPLSLSCPLPCPRNRPPSVSRKPEPPSPLSILPFLLSSLPYTSLCSPGGAFPLFCPGQVENVIRDPSSCMLALQRPRPNLLLISALPHCPLS